MSVINSRITEESSNVIIKSKGFDPRGIIGVYNYGSEKLEGNKFNLYQGFMLIDIDGCGNRPVILSREEAKGKNNDPDYCELRFIAKDKQQIFEIVYDSMTVSVQYD